MELTYEVAKLSGGFGTYVVVAIGLAVLLVIAGVTVSVGETTLGPTLPTLLAAVVFLTIFVVVPSTFHLNDRTTTLQREAIEKVYQDVDYNGGRFMTASDNGRYVKATVTDLGDNKILVQEYE